MINKSMKNNTPIHDRKQDANRRPNEVGGFYFSSGIKIIDPNTNEIILQKRGD